jgi:hypothetical protein
MIHDPPYITIHKGSFVKTTTIKKQKVIVFDLDETLGDFLDLVLLWSVETVIKTQEQFNTLLDLFPEFLRFGIVTILEYLYNKKKIGHCKHIYLYTNNRFSPEIPKYISNYFDYKLGIISTPLFDSIIGRFKLGNRIIEPRRTTNEKTHSDFIKCTLLPKNTDICFVDDVYHAKMNYKKIYYIQPAPYYHNLTKNTIIERAFAYSPLIFTKEILHNTFANHFTKPTNHMNNIQVSKKMMYYIKEFFYLSTPQNKTKKTKTRLSRCTRKHT